MCAIITGRINHFPNEQEKPSKVFEYMDKLMKVFPDFDYFHIHDFYKQIESDEIERRKLTSLSGEIRTVMQKLGYIENPPKLNAVYILSEKGREVKKKGGHFKYVKSLEPKTDWIKIIPIILTFVFGVFATVFLFKNYKLNKENNVSKIENIKLKKDLDSLKSLMNRHK